MEIGSWAIIQEPSLLALIPLIIFIVLAFREVNNTVAAIAGCTVGAVLLGLNLKAVAAGIQAALGSPTVMMGVIVMMGAALGALMNEARITHTIVYWFVKKIGVNTRTKAKIVLIICTITVCGLLGTMGGGVAVLAPIMIPIMASLGLAPTVVSMLFFAAGQVGIIVGPLVSVTLITMEVTGLTYFQLLTQAVLPFSVFLLIGNWIGANRVQKRLEGKECYEITEDMEDINKIVISKKELVATVAFLVTFISMVVYGVITKQGTNYALVVMMILAFVVTIFSKMNPNKAMGMFVKGLSSQTSLFLLFIFFQLLINMVNLGGGFDALSSLLGGMAKAGGPTGVMLVSALVGGFGIEAAAVAEIQIIGEMFGQLARDVGLPMGCFAVTILTSTRLTGATYPTSNFMMLMGTGRSTNIKEGLKISWMGVGCALVFVIIYAFVGPLILA